MSFLTYPHYSEIDFYGGFYGDKDDFKEVWGSYFELRKSVISLPENEESDSELVIDPLPENEESDSE